MALPLGALRRAAMFAKMSGKAGGKAISSHVRRNSTKYAVGGVATAYAGAVGGNVYGGRQLARRKATEAGLSGRDVTKVGRVGMAHGWAGQKLQSIPGIRNIHEAVGKSIAGKSGKRSKTRGFASGGVFGTRAYTSYLKNSQRVKRA